MPKVQIQDIKFLQTLRKQQNFKLQSFLDNMNSEISQMESEVSTAISSRHILASKVANARRAMEVAGANYQRCVNTPPTRDSNGNLQRPNCSGLRIAFDAARRRYTELNSRLRTFDNLASTLRARLSSIKTEKNVALARMKDINDRGGFILSTLYEKLIEYERESLSEAEIKNIFSHQSGSESANSNIKSDKSDNDQGNANENLIAHDEDVSNNPNSGEELIQLSDELSKVNKGIDLSYCLNDELVSKGIILSDKELVMRISSRIDIPKSTVEIIIDNIITEARDRELSNVVVTSEKYAGLLAENGFEEDDIVSGKYTLRL